MVRVSSTDWVRKGIQASMAMGKVQAQPPSVRTQPGRTPVRGAEIR